MDEYHLYLFPGLGFDQQIFRNLNLPYPNINFINWEEPRYKEHLEDYAFRLSKINATRQFTNDQHINTIDHLFFKGRGLHECGIHFGWP